MMISLKKIIIKSQEVKNHFGQIFVQVEWLFLATINVWLLLISRGILVGSGANFEQFYFWNKPWDFLLKIVTFCNFVCYFGS